MALQNIFPLQFYYFFFFVKRRYRRGGCVPEPDKFGGCGCMATATSRLPKKRGKWACLIFGACQDSTESPACFHGIKFRITGLQSTYGKRCKQSDISSVLLQTGPLLNRPLRCTDTTTRGGEAQGLGTMTYFIDKKKKRRLCHHLIPRRACEKHILRPRVFPIKPHNAELAFEWHHSNGISLVGVVLSYYR